jgi:hypothetical protein
MKVMGHPAATRFLANLAERRRSLRDEVEDDIADLRGLSLEERGRILESVCRDAVAILRARPDAEAAMAWQDPRSEESEQTWRALVARFRRSHGRH